MKNYRTWSDKEDLLLTTAASSVYQDRGRPEHIKSDNHFWGAVYEKIKIADPSFRRTQSAIRNRWDHIAYQHPVLSKVIKFRYQRKNKDDEQPKIVFDADAAAMSAAISEIKYPMKSNSIEPQCYNKKNTPEISAICRGIRRVANNLGVTTDDVIETIIETIDN